MNIYEAFSIPIAKFKWSQHEKFKEKFLDWMSNANIAPHSTHHTSEEVKQFRSPNKDEILLDVLPPELRDELKDFFEIQYTNYFNHILGWAGEGCKIIDCWLNVGDEGCHQDYHYHANSWVSGCYYLNFDSTHSPLQFQNPFWNTPIVPCFVGEPLRQTPYNSNFFIPDIEEGDLLMFPSNLVHGYEVSQSPHNNPRISIAANFLPKYLGQGKSSVYI